MYWNICSCLNEFLFCAVFNVCVLPVYFSLLVVCTILCAFTFVQASEVIWPISIVQIMTIMTTILVYLYCVYIFVLYIYKE